MKKVLLAVAVLVIVVVMADGAIAGTTGPLTAIPVTATVTGKCTIDSQSAALDFGALDPASGTAVNAATLTGSAAVKCTKNFPFTVQAKSANGGPAADCTAGTGIDAVLTDGSSHTMNYTFKCAAGTGNGFGSGAAVSLAPSANIDMTLTGNKDAYYGSYTDDITLTVNY